ncbi:MAG: hypothetical protein ACJ763_08250 [Bdellovibrionia bacterium]
MMNKYTNTGTNSPAPAQAGGPQEEERIRVNGFGQVLEMLKIADPDFRESLLRRLSNKDPELGRQLRQDLRKLGLL